MQLADHSTHPDGSADVIEGLQPLIQKLDCPEPPDDDGTVAASGTSGMSEVSHCSDKQCAMDLIRARESLQTLSDQTLRTSSPRDNRGLNTREPARVSSDGLEETKTRS